MELVALITPVRCRIVISDSNSQQNDKVELNYQSGASPVAWIGLVFEFGLYCGFYQILMSVVIAEIRLVKGMEAVGWIALPGAGVVVRSGSDQVGTSVLHLVVIIIIIILMLIFL